VRCLLIAGVQVREHDLWLRDATEHGLADRRVLQAACREQHLDAREQIAKRYLGKSGCRRIVEAEVSRELDGIIIGLPRFASGAFVEAGGIWHYYRRVPAEYSDLDKRGIIRLSGESNPAFSLERAAPNG
jgi:hypothetical protein